MIGQYNLIVLHSLNFFNCRITYKLNDYNKVLWMPWGFEIYNNPLALYNETLGEKSKKYTTNKKRFKLIEKFLRPIKYWLKYRTPEYHKLQLQVVKKIKLYGGLFQDEFTYFKSRSLINPDFKFIRFTYYPLELMLNGNIDRFVTADNILFGNSSSATNNHLEGLDILKTLDLKNRKVIVPLSYGDPNYREWINEKLLRGLGGNYHPLTEYITLEKYYELLQSCGIVIMNHYRQQAVGNIMIMLWMGAKVYLNEQNTVYIFLKRIGVTVFSIEKHLLPGNEEVFELLDNETVKNNRRILIKHIGKEALINNFKNDIA